MTTFNASRVRELSSRANPSIIEALSWTRAWAFNEAPDAPGAAPALEGTTSGDLSLVGTYTKSIGTGTMMPEAIGTDRLNEALRLDGITSRFGGSYGTSSDVRLRLIFRVPEIDGEFPVFSWGTAGTNDIRIRRLPQARGRIQVTRRVSNVVEYENTFDVGDGWVLLDLSLEASGSDTNIFVGVNGQIDSDTLTGVSYTGLGADIDVGSNFAVNRPGYIDFLFFGFLDGSVWTAADHTTAWDDSGLKFNYAPPHDFVRMGGPSTLELASGTVNPVLNDSEQALLSFWARSGSSQNDRVIAGRSDQIVVRATENGSSSDTVFATRSRNLIDAYDWNFYSWDFSGTFNVDGDLDPYTGGVTLANTNSTKASTQSVSTGALVPDAINNASVTRLDDATTSGGDYWTLDGELNTLEDDVHFRILMRRPSADGRVFYFGDSDNHLSMEYVHGSVLDDRLIRWSVSTDGADYNRTAYVGDAEWLLIDAWYRKNPSDDSIISGLYVNGPDQYNDISPTLNGEGNNTSDQFHAILGDEFDLFHFDGGEILDTDILFFGIRDWDGFDEATHEADWEASGLAPTVFETFSWDFSWLGKNATNGTDVTANIPAETGAADMITGNSGNGRTDGPGTYTTDFSTDGLRQGGIGIDNIDEAITPSIDWRGYANPVGLSGATGYHMRAVVKFESPISGGQYDILSIGDPDGNEQVYLYIQALQNSANEPPTGRVLIRTDLNGLSTAAPIVSDFKDGDWLIIDGWIGEVGNNVEMRVFLNGRETATPAISVNVSLPSITNEIHFSRTGLFAMGMPWLFFGVRQAPTPLTLAEHTADANRIGARISGGDIGVEAEHPWADGEWHHYAYAYNNQIPVGVWVDGNKVGESTTIGPQLPDKLNPSSSTFLLGEHPVDMAGLNIWGDFKALSERDISALYLAEQLKGESGFFRHSNPTGSFRGDLTYTLDSTTGFTANAGARALSDDIADLTNSYSWDHAWNFSEVPAINNDYFDPKDPYVYQEFSAAGSYQVSGPGYLDNLETVTLEFWYRSSTLPSTTAPKIGIERIMGRWGSFMVFKENNGGNPHLRFQIDNSTAVLRTTASVPELTDGEWHHYICSFRGGSSPTTGVFVDGQNKATSFVVGSSLPADTGTGSNFQVGSGADASFGSDEVQAFDLALSAIYQRPIVTVSTAREIYYNRLKRTLSPISVGTVYLYDDCVSTANRGLLASTRTSAITGTINYVSRYELTNIGSGSTTLKIGSGRSIPDQGVGGFGEKALGRLARCVGSNFLETANSPVYFASDASFETSSPLHFRAIFRAVNFNDDQSKTILQYGLGGESLIVNLIKRDTRFDVFAVFTRNNSQYLTGTLAQTSGSFENDSWIMLDVVAGPVDSENAFLELYVNGNVVGAEFNLDFQEIDSGGLVLNSSVNGDNMIDVSWVFFGVRSEEFSFEQHMDDWSRFKPRSVLFSGGRWTFPYAWDFTKEHELPLYRNTPPNFEPTDIASLTTWFDFDDLANSTRGEDLQITAITDKGPSAVTANITGDIQNSFWNAQRRAAVFSDVGDDITFTPTGISNYDEFWAAFVVDTRRTGAGRFLDDVNDDLRVHLPFTDGLVYFRVSSTGGFITDSGYDDRDYRLIIVYRHSVANSERYLSINGVLSSDTSPTASVSSSDITISTPGPDGIQVGDIIFGSGAFTDEDRQKIEGYLAWKWGLEKELPSDHPYASDLTITSWYDLSQIEGVDYDGFTRIRQVKDLSGNGNHLDDGSTSPRYVDFESKKGADFSGATNPVFNGNPWGDDPTLDDIWAFAVLNTDTADNHSVFTRDSATVLNASFGDASGQATISVGGNTLTSSASSVPADTLALAYWRNSDTDGVQEIYLDGAEIASGTNPGTASTTSDIVIGNSMEKTVGEIICGTGPMPAHKRELIEGYLAHKWGISLPSGHPYEDCPPAPLKAYQGDIDLCLGQGSAELRGPITDDQTSGANGSVYDLAFNREDLGAGRVKYLELGPGTSNGSGLYAVDNRLNFKTGCHMRLVFQANDDNSSDMTLLHLSQDADPSFRIYRDGTTGNYVAEYTNASASTFIATVTGTPNTGEWSLLDAWIEVSNDGEGMTIGLEINTIRNENSLSSEEFTGFGGNRLEVGDSTATAPIEEMGLIFLGIREGQKAYLIDRGSTIGRSAISVQARDDYAWQVAYSGEKADDTNWPSSTLRGPTLTASGSSGYDRNTGGLTAGDIGLQRVNKAVERLTSTSHSSTTGHDSFDSSRAMHIRTIVKPADNDGPYIWEFVQPNQVGVSHRFGIRHSSGTDLEFYYSGFRTWPVNSSTLGGGDLDLTLVTGHNVQVGDTIITRNLTNNITAEATVSAVSGNVVTAPLAGTEASNGSGYVYITSAEASNTLSINGIDYDQWNLIDITWTPNDVNGNIDILINRNNGSQLFSVDQIMIHPEVTEPSETNHTNVGIGIMCDPDGTSPDVGTDLLFVGWRNTVIINDMSNAISTGDYASSGIGSVMVGISEHDISYNKTKLQVKYVNSSWTK